MQKRIKTLSKRHFQDNFIIYFIISMFFIVGIIIGAIMINRLKIETNNNITNHYSWIFDYMNDGNPGTSDILKSNLFSTMKFSIIIWLSGLIVLGIFIIPLIIGWKGITIGFTVGLLIKEFEIKGLIFALSGLLPHYLIILPGIIAIGSIGLSHAIGMSKGRGKSLYKVHQRSLVDYTILFVLFFIIIIVGTCIESFMIPYLLKFIKFSL